MKTSPRALSWGFFLCLDHVQVSEEMQDAGGLPGIGESI
jgi:hypothetical protein